MTRPRIKSRRGLVGSSNFETVREARCVIQTQHEQFVGSALHTALMSLSHVERSLTPERVLGLYSEVRFLGHWIPLKKFSREQVNVFIEDKYSFR